MLQHMLRIFRQTDSRPPVLRRACTALSFCCATLLVSTARAQTAGPMKEATVLNRPVYLLANDKLEVAIVKQGGSTLRVLIQGDAGGLSPFGNPELVPAVPDNRKLQGSMVGHFVAEDVRPHKGGKISGCLKNDPRSHGTRLAAGQRRRNSVVRGR